MLVYHYLFGKGAVEMYHEHNGTVEQFKIKLLQSYLNYECFEYKPGITGPEVLLTRYTPWGDFAWIPEHWYHVLKNRNILTWEEVQHMIYNTEGCEDPESTLWVRGTNNTFYPSFF